MSRVQARFAHCTFFVAVFAVNGGLDELCHLICIFLEDVKHLTFTLCIVKGKRQTYIFFLLFLIHNECRFNKNFNLYFIR